jgi:hypothetical protein
MASVPISRPATKIVQAWGQTNGQLTEASPA